MDEAAPETIDTGPPPGDAPEFAVDEETGRVTVSWPGGMPEAVMMTPEVLERIVAERNDMVERLKAMEMVLAIVRLGRRPSKADWEAAKLPPLTPEVRTKIDLLSRRRSTL